jgi:flavin-dependent dehydrogenase
LRVGVIGGGLAGLFSSFYLLYAGCEVDIYEEHDRPGYPKHCTGLVSEQTMKMLGRFANKCSDAFFNKIKLEIPGSGNITLHTFSKIVHLDRVCIEEGLAEAILGLGGRFFWRTKAILGGDSTIVAGGLTTRYDHIVVAEGIRREIFKKVYKGGDSAKKVFGINIVYKARNDLEGINVGFHPTLAPGFFYWIFPISDEEIIVGLGTSEPKTSLRATDVVLKKYGISNAKKIDSYGGWIGEGPILKRQLKKNLTFVGDAFGLQKPLTGGGIYPIVSSFTYKNSNSCSDAIAEIRYGTEKVASILRKQMPIAKVFHSSSFYYILYKIFRNLNGTEIRDDYKLIDYDRHDLSIQRIFLHLPLFLKEIKF